MDGVAQQGRGLLAVPGRVHVAEHFQEQRHVVRQLVGGGLDAVFAVLLDQVDHGLAAVAALAVHVLEQMQRMRRVTVEGGNVVFLQGDEIGAAQRVEQRRQPPVCIGGGAEQAVDLGQGVQQLRLGVGEQGGEQVVQRRLGHDGLRWHQAALVFLRETGMLMVDTLAFLRPKSVPSDTPPEQPLPKLKPHAPFSSKLSCVISLCEAGMTKRSS